MKTNIKDSRGKIKKTIADCKGCGVEFRKHSWTTQEFCTKDCYFRWVRNSRPIIICEICGTKVTRHKSLVDRNDSNYCSRECYNKRAKDGLKHIKRHTKHYNDLLNDSICECGERKYLLEIHHIDGDNTNNDKSNIEIVCSNCHMKRHLKKNSKGEWVYHPPSLTKRSLLKIL